MSMLFLSNTSWDSVHVVIFRIDDILSAVYLFQQVKLETLSIETSRVIPFPSFRNLEIVAKSHFPVGWVGWVEVMIENAA